MKFLLSIVKIITWTALVLVGLAALLAAVVAVVYSRLDRTNGQIESSGRVRKYLLHVPDSYDPARPTPLVISIHGFAEWPAHQAQISRWNRLADQEGFIVVYPSGTGFPKRWKASQAGDASDVQFIADLIDRLERDYNIDPARIYANGLSNGGGMTYLLACALADRIAAVGGVSGAYLYPPEACRPARPVPLIAFHGDADRIVPFQGGASSSFDRPFPAVADWMRAWAERNGCRPEPEVLPAVGAASGVRYTGCQGEAEVIFYTLAGGGHSWPGGEPIPAWIVGATNQDIDATALMWDFFKQHPMGG